MLKSVRFCLLALAMLCAKVTLAADIASEPLTAGQTMPAGKIDFAIVKNALVITIDLAPGWIFNPIDDGVHIWMGDTIDAAPHAKNGAPLPGQFPYNSGVIANKTSYQLAISLSQLAFYDINEDSSFAFLIHTSLSQVDANGKTISTQTGWGGDTPGNSSRWFKYFTIHIPKEPPPPPPPPTTTPENPAITSPSGN